MMSNPNPPRFLPTLTEVVAPEAFTPAEQTQWTTAPQVEQLAFPLRADDTASITQTVIAKITPLLEQQLRNSAQQLLEVQVNVVLPALHRHIEAAVRQAIQETLVERSAYANDNKP